QVGLDGAGLGGGRVEVSGNLAVVEAGEQLALAHASVGLSQNGDDDALAQCGYVHLVFDHDRARSHEGAVVWRRRGERNRRGGACHWRCGGYSRGFARVAAGVQRQRNGHHGRELNNPFHKPSYFWPMLKSFPLTLGGQDARRTAGGTPALLFTSRAFTIRTRTIVWTRSILRGAGRALFLRDSIP